MKFFSWLKKMFFEWIGNIKRSAHEQRYLSVCLWIMTLPLGAAGALFLFWAITAWAVGMIAKYATEIAVFVGIPVFVLYWLSSIGNSSAEVAKIDQLSDYQVAALADQGLQAMLEIVFVVLNSLSAHTPIAAPSTLGDLPCPSRSTCIRVKDGVAIISIMSYYTEPIEPQQFMDKFNAKLFQMLDEQELPNAPKAVFYDKYNRPHKSIQAIACTDCGGFFKLDIVQVNDAAVKLLNHAGYAKTLYNTPRTDYGDKVFDGEL